MEDKPAVCSALSAEVLKGGMWKKVDETIITFPELDVFRIGMFSQPSR